VVRLDGQAKEDLPRQATRPTAAPPKASLAGRTTRLQSPGGLRAQESRAVRAWPPAQGSRQG
jgi:hypothetical protein